MPSSDFISTIVAGGQRYTAWKSVMVRRDYMNWLSVFEFTAAEPGDHGGGWSTIKLKPGDPVQVYLGGDKVIDGSITTRQAAFDATSHDLVIGGKSLTQDLKSSIKTKPGKMDGYTFEQAARGVLGQVGVGLVIKNPPALASKPFKSLCPQFGEQIGEFIERIAKMRGFFLTDDENGKLVASQLDPSAAPVAELQEGRNILRAVCTLDNQNAWSGLTGVGQNVGDDWNWPPRDQSATVTNSNATTKRTQIFAIETPEDAEGIKERVNFEQSASIHGDVNAQITVVGWHKDDGSLWIPTENVNVLAPSLFPSTSGAITLAIQAVVYAQDSQNGTTTTLHLRKTGALTTLPSPFDGQTEFSGASTSYKPNAAQVDPQDISSGLPASSEA